METIALEAHPHRQLYFLSKRQIAGLLYVVIAIAVIGLATVESQGNVQWYSTVYNLDLHVDQITYQFARNASYAIVHASVYNPSGFSRLVLSDANYMLFVNSTTEPFNVQGSTQIGAFDVGFQQSIPASGGLNLTRAVPIMNDTVATLQPFLQNHKPPDLITYAGVTLYFRSSLGRYSVPYCYTLPDQMFTSCPAPRGVPSMRGGGGGG